MEEIVGKISDAFDKSAPPIQRLPDGSVLIDGLTQIEEVNDQLGLNLSDAHYDTIAGLVLGRLGRMARVGDTIEAGGVRLKVEALDGLRIAASRSSTPRPRRGRMGKATKDERRKTRKLKDYDAGGAKTCCVLRPTGLLRDVP